MAIKDQAIKVRGENLPQKLHFLIEKYKSISEQKFEKDSYRKEFCQLHEHMWENLMGCADLSEDNFYKVMRELIAECAVKSVTEKNSAYKYFTLELQQLF